MTYDINLPYLDETGLLTPLVVDALANGATADHHPTDKDQIVLSFPTKAALKAFEAAAKLPDTTADMPDAPTPAPAPSTPAPAPTPAPDKPASTDKPAN